MLSPTFKPSLAEDAVLDNLKFPLIASPKLDGIRAIKKDGIMVSRSLKPIRNEYIQECLKNLPEGLDGELIVGSPTDPSVYNATSSGVMSRDGEPDFQYLVFDHAVYHTAAFSIRLNEAAHAIAPHQSSKIKLHDHSVVCSLSDLLDYENKVLEQGYEGLIVRRPDGWYKFGRSTVKEALMLKIKRFEDSEAEIVGYEPLMHNTNEATVNELGRTARSSDAAGLVAMPMIGAFTVRDIHNDWEFKIGSGSAFTHASRSKLWGERDNLLGRIVKYKFFRHGMKDVPRHPNFLGFRDKTDL